jgi:hypothetical protein
MSRQYDIKDTLIRMLRMECRVLSRLRRIKQRIVSAVSVAGNDAYQQTLGKKQLITDRARQIKRVK